MIGSIVDKEFWLLLILLRLTSVVRSQPYSNHQILEGRIYENAPTGTVVTLHPKLEQYFHQYRECLLHVSGEDKDFNGANGHGSDGKYFSFNLKRLAMEAVRSIDKRLGDYYWVSLRAYCLDSSKSGQWMIRVRVSEKNLRMPFFEHTNYTFHVSARAPNGTIVGVVKAMDSDIIIYSNSISYRALEDTRYTVDEFGRIKVNRVPAEPVDSLTVIACDYGSPSGCATTDVKIVSVVPEPPLNVQVISADINRQIVCWSFPVVHPDWFVIRVELRDDRDVGIGAFTVDVKPANDTYRQCTLIYSMPDSHTDVANIASFSFRVGSRIIDEEALSEFLNITVEQPLSCNGTCYNNGTPACVKQGNHSDVPAQFIHNNHLYCSCPTSYDGYQCENIRYCNGVSVQSEYGILAWKKTPVGQTINIKCPFGPTFNISRTCLWHHSSIEPFWNTMQGAKRCRNQASVLTLLSSINFFEKINIKDVLTSLMVLEQSIDAAVSDSQLAGRMTAFLNSMIESDVKFSEKVELMKKIRKLLNQYASKLMLSTGESSMIRQKSFVLMVSKPNPDGEEPLILTVGDEVNAKNFSYERSNKFLSVIPTWNLNYAQLKIPRCILKLAAVVVRPRITAVWMRDDKLFDLSAENGNDRNSYRAILDISIEGLPEHHPLIEPIRFSLRPPNSSAKSSFSTPTCVYWHEKRKRWENDGVDTLGLNPKTGLVDCQTNHLTGFSILLDFEPSAVVDILNRRILNLLSWVGCGCSTVSLIFTILTYSMFRCLNRDRAGRILLNLCTSMLCMNLMFILSSLRPVIGYKYGGCVFISAMLHYFTLSTLLWMGVEAANMYHMLIHVFASTERLFMLKRCAIAWGTPLLLVAAVLSTSPDHYFDKNDIYCRLAVSYIVVRLGTYLAPACLILLVNSVIFAFILKVLTQASSATKWVGTAGKQQKYSTIVSQIRAGLTVMMLLGITWVLGAFAFGPLRLTLMYAFSGLNSLQGFIIFCVRCLFYEEARNAWWLLLRAGKLKQRRGQALLLTTDSTGSHGVHKRRNSANLDANFQSLDAGTAGGGRRADLHAQRQALIQSTDTGVRFDTSCQLWKFIDDPATPRIPRR